MKTNNQDFRQNRKLRKQVSHLSGFIGMPMWNGRNPSLNEIREYDRRIIEQQTKDLKPKRKSLLKRIFSWIFQNAHQSLEVDHSKKAIAVVKKKKKKESNEIDTECCMQANT